MSSELYRQRLADRNGPDRVNPTFMPATRSRQALPADSHNVADDAVAVAATASLPSPAVVVPPVVNANIGDVVGHTAGLDRVSLPVETSEAVVNSEAADPNAAGLVPPSENVTAE